MPEAELEHSGQLRSERAVELRIAPRLENLAVLRTLVGAVGTFADLNIDKVADLRLAIDELCTQLIGAATPDATLVVVIDPRDDEVVLQASAACTTLDVMSAGSFSWHVLTALADDVHTFHRDGHEADASGAVFGVTLTARRVGSVR